MINYSRNEIKKLYAHFSSIWGNSFISNHKNDESIKLWIEEWYLGLAGVPVETFNEALDKCRISMDWSPSIAQFRKLCEKASGMPSEEELYLCVIRRDFKHPLVQLIRDRIGDWSISRDTEKEVRKKFKLAYDDEMAKYRMAMRQEALKQIEERKRTTPLGQLKLVKHNENCST
jgi:hypothetical protein